MYKNKKYFTSTLLSWNEKENIRQMPWKGEIDPYKIWLSEIILQQTRVEQGWNYYNSFIAAFPTVKKLANAPDEKIFKLWEGLGYYTRCKNLIATAKFISKERKGNFPKTYEEILALKGVGPYTAAAIASFAFNLPHAVVDGNVFRVLSRFFGINEATDNSSGKKLFADLAEELLDKTKPGAYNQAIMDFGAVICKPKYPLCNTCVLKAKCVARITNQVELLPVKSKVIKKRKRYFYYFVVECNNKVFVRKRGPKDIWENLYEFVLLEQDNKISVEGLRQHSFTKNLAGRNNIEKISISRLYTQQLTHQTIAGRFVYLGFKKELTVKHYDTISFKTLKELPFPKFITEYLAENDVQNLGDKNVSLNLLKR